MRQITFSPTFAGWLRAARMARSGGIEPGRIVWRVVEEDHPALTMEGDENPASSSSGVTGEQIQVPRAFLQMAERVARHDDPERWVLLYRVLWRLTHGEPRLIEIVDDPDVHELLLLDRSIRREDSGIRRLAGH